MCRITRWRRRYSTWSNWTHAVVTDTRCYTWLAPKTAPRLVATPSALSPPLMSSTYCFKSAPILIQSIRYYQLLLKKRLDLRRLEYWIWFHGVEIGREYVAPHSHAEPAVSVFSRQGALGERSSFWPGQLGRPVIRPPVGGNTTHSPGGQPTALHHSQVSLRPSYPSTSPAFQLADTVDVTTFRSQALITASSSRTVCIFLHSWLSWLWLFPIH